jgi:hypothetical protein
MYLIGLSGDWAEEGKEDVNGSTGFKEEEPDNVPEVNGAENSGIVPIWKEDGVVKVECAVLDCAAIVNTECAGRDDWNGVMGLSG